MTATTSAGTETVEQFRLRVRGWLAAHVPLKTPDERFLQWEEEGVARDRAIQRSLWEGRVAGVTVPVDYGGLGLGAAHQQAFREEAGAYRMPHGHRNAFNVVLPTMLAHASEEMKREFIPQILNGDHLWCQLLSEPSGGSDLAGVLTRATRDGETWVLNGAKIWTTGGHRCDYGICLARTNPEAPKHAGLTMFVVPMKSPGMTVLPLKLTDGTADFCQEFIDNLSIPAHYVIGEVDYGWTVTTTLMQNERTAPGRGCTLGDDRGGARDRGIGHDPD